MTIGIFYGTNTSSTESVAKCIQKELVTHGLHAALDDIAHIRLERLQSYDLIMIGCPTWYIGEVQENWEEKRADIAALNLQGKHIAFFGCGDHLSYPDTFQDALGILWQDLQATGASLVGRWENPYKNRVFSKALDSHYFIGLALDEDNQAGRSNERMKQWLARVIVEINHVEINHVEATLQAELVPH